MSPFLRSKKVAITGTFGAGKSVFLLSLLHQLHNHDPRYFRVGEGREDKDTLIKNLIPQTVGDSQFLFPYKTFAQRLMKAGGGIWPSRYSATQRFRIAFKRSARFKRDELDFMTFPLERLLDLNIARIDKYSDWADRVLFHIEEDKQALRAARPYLIHLDAQEQFIERLIRLYKTSLTQFIFDYKTFTAPSTFMIDLHGGRIDGGAAESVSQARFLGLPPGDGSGPKEFIPLSGIARMRLPEFLETQEKNYELYRSQLLKPLFGEVNQADTLLILLDIPALLSAGRGAFDEQKWLLGELSKLLKYKNKGGQVLGRSQVKRVALIANKCDLVRTFEREARLPLLLRQLTDDFVERLHKSVEIGRFICSPCMATRPHQDPQSLVGRLINPSKNSERGEVPFNIPEVPKAWPQEYTPQDFPFAKVWPPALQAHEKLPRHYRLDDVFRFILQD